MNHPDPIPMELAAGGSIDTGRLFEDYRELAELEHLYNAAIRQLTIKFEILNDEFRVKYERSPIHHIESRVKSTASIVNKLLARGKEVTPESARENVNDIAGVRVVCCYIDDVYSVADMLLRQTDIRLIREQDYIREPNYNGYRSLHLDIELPIYLSERTEMVKAEVQLRTVAMDFWASLEHDLRYKNAKAIPAGIGDRMLACADEIAAIDREMQEIYKEIQAL
ncbi:MAG: GTP pyrophosphokinase family protein [Clostridia bacterium]|nr:GTP pyrophosphokinase family protein [Clostridia bacterium]MBR5679778.1 GTP pyrophosphokinase family protein [Clostridia bacterium]